MKKEELNIKMQELAKFAIPSNNYNEKKANEYYKVQKLYLIEKNKLNKKVEKTNNFVNNYSEATHREITCQTYKNQQARLSKEILNFIR